ISDPIGVLLWLFAGGAEPPAPGPRSCGLLPEGAPGAERAERPAAIGCAAYPACP
ncbi:MAG: hypothetical protein HY721_18115, partial [Planctomycetes bacterium]|nr:hypothetical protein [Planctomycetota bacterium]